MENQIEKRMINEMEPVIIDEKDWGFPKIGGVGM